VLQKRPLPPGQPGERGFLLGGPLRCVGNHYGEVTTSAPAQSSMAVWISDALIPKTTPTSLEPKPVARRTIVPADSARKRMCQPSNVFCASRVLCGLLTNSSHGCSRTG